LATLACLAELGSLPQATSAELAKAYEFLRNLEHALQYVDDAQTHLLPTDVAARTRVAELMGASDANPLITHYRRVRECVAEAFDAVFAEPDADTAELPLGDSAPGGANAAALSDRLAQMGYSDPAATAQRLQAVLSARRIQTANGAARERIERLLRSGLEAAAASQAASRDIGPDELFARFAQLIEVVAGRSTYIALLNEFP